MHIMGLVSLVFFSVGTPSKFSPAPTYNVDNHMSVFALFVEKTRHFLTTIRRDGGYVIELKCPI